MGMGMDNFCRCTPSEFRSAWDAWDEMRQAHDRGAWERMRMECLCTLQPWSKKRLSARDIMEFPWEEKKISHKDAKMGKEEVMRRYRKAKAAAGLK